VPGRRITDEQKARFWSYRNAGLGVPDASDRAGFSRKSGWRLDAGLSTDSKVSESKKRQTDLPNPRLFADLDGGVKDTLEDFSLWAETFLAWRRVPWQRDAAHRVAELIIDKSEKHYGDINLPPGAGKSTTFTFAIPAWLICGGGFLDPAYGRAMRILLGHEKMATAIHYVLRVRRLLELRRPYYDKEQKRHAELVLAREFGRFRPLESLGEEKIWSAEQFLVAQLEDVDLYEKEPTVQAASREAGFLGERVDYYSWDDITTGKTTRSMEVADATNEWFETEAETRVEPGGVGLLVGQRLNQLDLHNYRLKETYTDDEGLVHKKYFHVKYPVHHEPTCDGNHRQWDAQEHGDGCLLDAVRWPWREILKIREKSNYRTVYQQEDADPTQVLVLKEWLDGGTDWTGYKAPGCYDDDRGFYEWPKDVGHLINYVTVDPAAGGWWAIEWWAVQPETRFRYLIAGFRRRMSAGMESGLLDWDPLQQKHIGIMEELQKASVAGAQPILVWVIEAASAFKHLFEYMHYRTWLRRWSLVTVIAHQTGLNKLDAELGVEATLPMAYKTGYKRLPHKRGDASWLSYIGDKVDELTSYPFSRTIDTIMADWFGEANLERIIAIGKGVGMRRQKVEHDLPPYLEEQLEEMSFIGGEE